MRKAIAAFFIIVLVGMNFFSYMGKNYVNASEYTVIPQEAIRLRILANSNSEADQRLKREVRDRVNENINKWVADLTSLEEGRAVIKSHLGDIETIVEETLTEKNASQSYKVEFNNQVDFPTKVYGNFVYPAGEYEAILITLGEGSGANWWCVLFPPLCFLDFSNGDAVKAATINEEQVSNEVTDAEEQQPSSQEKAGTEEKIVTKEQQMEEATANVTERPTTGASIEEEVAADKVEVKFFLKEWMDSLF